MNWAAIIFTVTLVIPTVMPLVVFAAIGLGYSTRSLAMVYARVHENSPIPKETWNPMPQLEQVPYEPEDDVGIFMSSEDENVGGSRLPLHAVLALPVLGIVAGLVLLAYSENLAGGHQAAKPPVTRPGPPAKVEKVPAQIAKPMPSPVQAKAAAPTVFGAKAKRIIGPSIPSLRGPGPTASVATPPESVATTPTKPPGGSYILQIGAYKSEADADAAWKAYGAKRATLLSGYGHNVQKADLGDKGVWYRLRIVGFSDKNAASGLCNQLKTAGDNCFVSKSKRAPYRNR